VGTERKRDFRLHFSPGLSGRRRRKERRRKRKRKKVRGFSLYKRGVRGDF
jgi:hypothetical protein